MDSYKITFKKFNELPSSINGIGKNNIYLINIKIENLDDQISNIIKSISDTSWISKLDAVNKASYDNRAQKTIEVLIGKLIKRVEDEITGDLGEMLVSHSAKDILEFEFAHEPIPLAELWHAKRTGNPSFDFHSESPEGFVIFGEGKYQSSNSSPYGRAASQINDFIQQKKDIDDLVHIKNFATIESTEKVIDGKKGFAIAFSMNSSDYETIFNNALKSEKIKPLLSYPELYLIGVEI